MRTQIALYAGDAEWFEDLKKRVAQQRDGNPPTNAELARMMMGQFDPEDVS